MLAALRRVSGSDQILPFVRLFYGSQSRYFWEDDAAVMHHILQGEGREQGDPLMPLLFSLGIHDALHASQQGLGSKHLMAFHDDVYVVTLPHRVAQPFSVVLEQLRRHSNIRVHLGKIKVWNASGVEPRACQILQRIADAPGNRESVWKGIGLPTELQGIKVLGTPLGHPDFVAAHLDRVLSETALFRSASSGAGRPVRVGSAPSQCRWPGQLPSQSRQTGTHGGFCHGHDEGLWRCICEILRVTPRQRYCFLTPGAGRVGTLERSPIQAVRLLGKLPHGQDETPSDCRVFRGGFCDRCGSSFLGGSRGLPSEFDGRDVV